MLGFVGPTTYKASLPGLTSDFYNFREAEDELAASLLSSHIWRLLQKSRSKLSQVYGCEGGVSILLPADFLNRLARDVVRMTEGEEHRIRGCILQIEYHDGSNRVRVGRIKCDPHLPTITHLTLSMTRAHKDACPTRKTSLLRLLGLSNENIYISPGYTIEKRRIRKAVS